MPKSHASPREDSRYHGKPLWLDFDVAWRRHTQFKYEWIIPPADPPNLYSDYLRAHGEGVQHLGLLVDDLDKSIAAYQKLGYSVGQSGALGRNRYARNRLPRKESCVRSKRSKNGNYNQSNCKTIGDGCILYSSSHG